MKTQEAGRAVRDREANARGKGQDYSNHNRLLGRVTAVGGKTLTMEISEKVRVRVLRSAVSGQFDADAGDKK